MKKIFLLMLLIILTFNIISCNSDKNNLLSDEDAYIEQMEALKYSLSGVTVGFDSLFDMIEHTYPNLIVRCKVLSRDEVTVKHVTDLYTTNDLKNIDNLKSTDPEAAKYIPMYISTPYDIEILEVYMGDVNKAGDIIKFYAPYGTIDGYSNRRQNHPIFKVGEEYIIFMRVDMFNDIPSYYLSYAPGDVLVLDSSGKSFEMTIEGFSNLYREFENSVEKLVSSLKEYLEKSNYQPDMEYIYR